MIPFAICGGQLNISSGNATESLEIRFLELAPDYCTFRIPLDRENNLVKISSVRIRFSLNTGKEVILLSSGEFSIEILKHEKYWVEVALSTTDTKFRTCSMQLSSEYLSYIRAKLTMDDAELAHHLTGTYPKEEEVYAGSAEEQLKRMREKVCDSYNPDSWNWMIDSEPVNLELNSSELTGIESISPFDRNKISFGIALESIAAYEEWKKLGHQAYVKKQLDRLGLCDIDHIFARQRYYYVYIGNFGCFETSPRLLSNEAHYFKDISSVVVLPPASESSISDIKDYLENLDRHQITMELMVNDEGIKFWIQKKQEEGFFRFFRIRDGVLMNKTKRDPRIKYLNHCEKTCSPELCEEVSVPFGLCETTTTPFGLCGTTLFLPWYQMNTGTFCPLHALVTKGDRGKSSRVTNCLRYCEKASIQYPAHLNMMGRFNSVFGADLESFTDGRILREVIQKYKDRVKNMDDKYENTELRVILNV